jgi:broad specificity phosphatase PhoE
MIWAREIEAHGAVSEKFAVVYASDEQASAESAQIVANQYAAKQKQKDDLVEVDVGLWEGLTPEELSRRYPKVYKRWREEPLSVCPPEGEAPEDSSARLREAIQWIIGRQNGNGSAIILGPVAFAVARRIIEGDDQAPHGIGLANVPVVYDVALSEESSEFVLENVVELGMANAVQGKRSGNG